MEALLKTFWKAMTESILVMSVYFIVLVSAVMCVVMAFLCWATYYVFF